MIVSSKEQFKTALEAEMTTMTVIDDRIVFISKSGEEVRYYLPEGEEPNTTDDYYYAYTREPINKVY